MKRKNSTIKLTGLVLEMKQVLVIVDCLWKRHGNEAVITAGTEAFDGNDLIHSTGSLHPFGRALDFRTYYFSREIINKIEKELIKALGPDYDIVVHEDHIHIEYDPE